MTSFHKILYLKNYSRFFGEKYSSLQTEVSGALIYLKIAKSPLRMQSNIHMPNNGHVGKNQPIIITSISDCN